MPEVRVHFGTPKTGTTALQVALANSRLTLRERGVYYPDLSALMTGTSSTNHNALARVLTDPDWEQEPAIEILRAAMAANLADGLDVVLSAESLYNRSADDIVISPRLFSGDYWSDRERYLRRLAKFLEPLDVPVTLVAAIRPQDEFAEASYSELSKSFRSGASGEVRLYREDLIRYCEVQQPLWDYDRQFELMGELLAEPVVVRYGSQAIAETTEALGIPSDAYSVPPRVNTTADARLVLWLTHFPFGTREQRQAFGHSDQARECLEDFGSTTLWPDDATRTEFLAQFSTARYGGDFFSKETRKATPARLTSEDAVRLAGAFFAWLEDSAGARAQGFKPPWESST